MIARRVRHHGGRVWPIVAAVVGCVVLYVRDPAEGAPYPGCPFRALTGLDCPFCGFGRAMHALLRLDPGRAVDLYPLIAALPAAVLAYVLGRRATTRAIWVGIGALVVFAVVRNLPFEAVSWMASYR